MTKYKPSLYELDPEWRSTIPISLGIPPPRPIQTKLSWAKTTEWDAKQEALLADLNKPYDEKFGTPGAANNDPGAANANRKRKRMEVVLHVRPEELARLSGSFIKSDEDKNGGSREEQPRPPKSKNPGAKHSKPKSKKKTAQERKEISAKAAATRKRNAEKMKKEAAEEPEPGEKNSNNMKVSEKETAQGEEKTEEGTVQGEEKTKEETVQETELSEESPLSDIEDSEKSSRRFASKND